MVTTRYYFLDWLRVIAILLLLFFHTGMLYAPSENWHISDEQSSWMLQELMFFLSRWRMALLFLISGAGTYFALRKRTGRAYVSERFKRLQVPLIFGIFVVVPPQIYFERLTQGIVYDSYWQFWKTVFYLEPYPAGSTSYHHLWFIAYLFIYALLALPIFLHLRSEKGKQLLVKAMNWKLWWCMVLMLAIVFCILIDRFPGPQDFVSDWAMFGYYFLFFVFGYLFAIIPNSWEWLQANRHQALKIGFIAIFVLYYLRWNQLRPEEGYTIARITYLTLFPIAALGWVTALLGYGKKYLSKGSKLLTYCNEGIYPFYILHQSVIIIIAYYTLPFKEEVWLKYLFINLVTLFLCVGVYKFFIRPYNLPRFLFGMNPLPPKSTHPLSQVNGIERGIEEAPERTLVV